MYQFIPRMSVALELLVRIFKASATIGELNFFSL